MDIDGIEIKTDLCIYVFVGNSYAFFFPLMMLQEMKLHCDHFIAIFD